MDQGQGQSIPPSPLASFIAKAAAEEPVPQLASGRYCCVVGCHNNQGKDKKRGIKFHPFPKDAETRHLWNKAINRSLPNNPTKLWEGSNFDVVCSDHFHGGKKIK